jgi:hypothetical protein
VLVISILGACTATTATAPAVGVAASPPAGATSISPVPDLPLELIGSWTTSGENPATLELRPCAAGQACGRFERFDGQERCTYSLELRSNTRDEFVFWTEDTNSFGCGWSGWWHTDVYIHAAADGALVISHNKGMDRETLHRVTPSPAAAP